MVLFRIVFLFFKEVRCFLIEYNFWDDRTHEVNEAFYRPVVDDYCLEWDCDECEAYR